ncbi:MAG: CPBP family intramembrane metalloprotease [Betaproteobacteria bacterium]|nr:CPBP family intramembrane metalloprotease [Betaproteobacteria bacterium]
MSENSTAITISRLPALSHRQAGRLALRLALPLAAYYASAWLVQRTGATPASDILFPLIAAFFVFTYVEGVKTVEGRVPTDVRPFSVKGALLGIGLALIGLTLITVGLSLYLTVTAPGSPSLMQSIATGSLSFEELLRSRTVAAAVAAKEEILFRALLLRWLVSFMPPGRVVLLQAVAFGAEHWIFGAYSILNATLVGITLGVLYLRTHNLWVVLGFHFSWDFFIYVLSGGFSHYTRTLSTTQQQDLGLAYLAVYVLCQALMIILAVWITRRPGTLLRPA